MHQTALYGPARLGWSWPTEVGYELGGAIIGRVGIVDHEIGRMLMCRHLSGDPSPLPPHTAHNRHTVGKMHMDQIGAAANLERAAIFEKVRRPWHVGSVTDGRLRHTGRSQGGSRVRAEERGLLPR